jgi:hypothetical protein
MIRSRQGALRVDPRLNLLTAEAIAVALMSRGSIRLANESPPLIRASDLRNSVDCGVTSCIVASDSLSYTDR